MNLGQDITMQAVAGQTVKPGQVLKRQICDILVRIWCGWAAPAGGYGGIWPRNRGFPALTNGSGDDPRLRFCLPTPDGTGRITVGACTNPQLSRNQVGPTTCRLILRIFGRRPQRMHRPNCYVAVFPCAFAEFQPPGGSVIV